ncbi:aldehyde dehydrogenase (NAD+) [Cryptococcus deuterogattii MMRL2647]|nr:aldehyde dehydrogenase (NAD+) [Cryptococcus deuterogattii MMRL2647]
MSFPEHTPTPLPQIEQICDTLNKRFNSGVTRSLAYRLFNLKQLAYLIKDNETLIQAAVEKDQGKGPFDVTLGELWPALNEIDLAVKNVENWMKDETRTADAILSMKTMPSRVRKQPKGVALIISTWNYPWQLSLCPLVGAISAGCPAILKLSEHAPTSSALLANLLPKYLDPEGYAAVLGEVEQSQALLAKPWGHILYTGSAGVGKIVAGAAAQTLTPTTLELGGKSPVIVSSDANFKITAQRMFSIKQMTGGQVCVAPDYVLCVKDKVDEFISVCKSTLDEFFPPLPSPKSLLNSPSGSSFLRSPADFSRQLSYIEKAEKGGNLVYKGEMDEKTRRMGISLIKLNENGEGEEGGVMVDEIFGPVLIIIPVKDIDAAIAYVNARPKPLALYVCAGKRSVFEKIISQTTSGSATWNDFAVATFARNVPFGGVGASGWGSYHGKDGFNAFTHHKAQTMLTIAAQRFEPLMSLRYPPISSFAKKVLSFLMFAGINFSRPKSIEHEEELLRRKTWRWRLIVFGFLMGALAGGKMLLGKGQ